MTDMKFPLSSVGETDAPDMLDQIFSRQEEFMELLEQSDLMVPWPIDITTKQGQRIIKEIAHNMHGEIFEATYTLKNKLHRLTDDRTFDREHYVEELGDALAFFVELCIMSGISADELYAEYCRKNAIVKKKFKDGY
jgi:hypothetical protein